MIARFIDGYFSSLEIANCFANKYEHLFNAVMTNNGDMQMLYNNVCCEQRENCTYNTKGDCNGIPYDIVIKSTIKLKTNKNEGLTPYYFRKGTPLLYKCISFLLTCMIN